MKFNSLTLFTALSFIATAVTVAHAEESNPCDPKAQCYLMSIGNQESTAYGVAELQLGYSYTQSNDETVYKYANYRLEGSTQIVNAQLVLDSKTCLLKSMSISRTPEVQVDRRHDP